MIDRKLTSEQSAIQEMARRFADSEIAPLARNVDVTNAGFPEMLLAKMRDAGFFGMGMLMSISERTSDIHVKGLCNGG